MNIKRLIPFLVAGVLTAVAALTVHYPVWANIPINIGIPLLIIIFGAAKSFEKLKLSTLIWGRILIAVAALGILNGQLAVEIIFWLLRLNILEAMYEDGKKRNYPNILSGLFVLIGTFAFSGTWIEKYFLIHPESVLFWCLAYTVWNWNFVIHNFKKAIGAFHIAVLTAPLLYCLVTWEIGFWLIMRATSLTIAGCLQVGLRPWIEKTFNSKRIGRAIDTIKKTPYQWSLTTLVLILSIIAWWK